MQVSVLGFGGSEVGYEGATARTVGRLLAGAIDAGLNVIDTAECYADSETLIGKSLGTRRRDVYVFTKCGHAGGWGRPNWSVSSILASVERSLRRLATDYVDLIQLHSCSLGELERGVAITALERARERGLARYIGYSGDGDAARYAVESGRFDTLQTSVNVADQEALELTLPIALERGLGVIAKRPIANVAWRYRRTPAEPYHRTYWSRLRTLEYAFLQREATAVATALRFTLSTPGVHTAIVGTAQPDRWEQNARLITAGALPRQHYREIPERWKAVADDSWRGQV
jgi:aryl-alcohol dehydrogenase-like predicted oxidoreductase